MDDSAFAARLAESGAAIERELEALLTRGSEARRAGAAGAPHPGDALCDARRGKTAQAIPHGGDGARARTRRRGSAPRGRGDRMHSCLFADSRRPSGDGRRRPEARAADHSSRLRRSDGDSRRRRAAGAGVRDPGRSGDRSKRRSARRPLRRPCARLGLAGMVGGQMLDLDAEDATAPLSVEAIARLQAMKTGALLRFSVEAGSMLAGAGAKASAALSTYGRAIGAAFQVADDILDAEGDAATLGKRARRTLGATRPRSSARSGSRARGASSVALSTRRRRRSTRQASARGRRLARDRTISSRREKELSRA